MCFRFFGGLGFIRVYEGVLRLFGVYEGFLGFRVYWGLSGFIRVFRVWGPET